MMCYDFLVSGSHSVIATEMPDGFYFAYCFKTGFERYLSLVIFLISYCFIASLNYFLYF